MYFGYNPSIDRAGAHRVRPSAAGVWVHGGAEEGAGPVQGPRDVALSDGLLDYGRVALRAAAPPTASGSSIPDSSIFVKVSQMFKVLRWQRKINSTDRNL